MRTAKEKMKETKTTAPTKNDKSVLSWLARAYDAADRPIAKGGSPHPRVKVGAVLVSAKGEEIARAANRFACGVDHRPAERYDDATRSLWFNCAEQMAIAQAAAKGAALKGATFYMTLRPCATCAGLIAESGIRTIVVPKDSCRTYGTLKAKWKKSIAIGEAKLREAGVTVREVEV